MTLTGARVSFIDIDRDTRKIVNSGIAYDSVFDRVGRPVTKANQIHEKGKAFQGFSRLCSATLVESGDYGFVDRIFFTGEEVGDPTYHPYGGSLWALDVNNRAIHGVAAIGRMSFENIAPLSIDESRVALLIGDDSIPQSDSPQHFGRPATTETSIGNTVAAPLWLYIGKKMPLYLKSERLCPVVSKSPHSIFESKWFIGRNPVLFCCRAGYCLR